MVIRVGVADDHPVVRRGIAQMISAEPDMLLVLECSTAADLLARVGQAACNVVIVDINLPDGNGIDLVGLLREQLPNLPVLILSIYPAEQFAARAIRAGAAGYLTKESATEDLIQAVRTVVSGRRYLTPETAEALASAVQLGSPSSESPDEILSPRERHVVALYAAGRTVTDIADSMQISVRTVSTYKTRVMEKLNLSSNADLIAWALRNHVVVRASASEQRS